MNKLVVRLIPDLSAAAFKKKAVDLLALWHCLRAINTTGCGHLLVTDAIEGLTSSFGYSRKQISRTFADGEGKFWLREYSPRRKRYQARIYSLEKVCQYLDTYLHYDCRMREVNASEFNTTLMRRAQIYTSIHKPESMRAKPLSRECIEEMTGLAKMQQWRYEKIAKVKHVAQFPMHNIDGKIQHIKRVITTKAKGTRTINDRLPNVYHTKQQSSSVGMLLKVKRQLKASKSLMTDEATLAQTTKRYYKGISAMLKGLRKATDREAYYRLRPDNRLIRGRQEWVKQTVCHGVYI